MNKSKTRWLTTNESLSKDDETEPSRLLQSSTQQIENDFNKYFHYKESETTKIEIFMGYELYRVLKMKDSNTTGWGRNY